MSTKKWPLIIEPSLLAADHGRLAEEAKKLTQAGADAIHIDVMDGHFVHNFSFGPQAVAAVNKATDLFLDVHLMIYSPFDYIEQFVEAGADRITFHIEATEDVEETLQYIRKCNIEAGLAICPETSAGALTPYIDKCDLILLMTVHPGFGGQAFIEDVLEKIAFTRSLVDAHHIRHRGEKSVRAEDVPPFNIQVDGGITQKTAKQCVEKGANVLVAGTYLFKGGKIEEKMQSLKDLQ